MKITIPIRGSDFESATEGYSLFLNEIILFSSNSKLILLIDDLSVPEKNEIPRIKDIKFKIVEGNRYTSKEPQLATLLNTKHSFFHTEWINEYLLIDFKIIEEKSVPKDFIPYLIDDFLVRLNFLINLTYSTNVDFLEGVIYSDSEEYIGKTTLIISLMMFAYEHASKMNWPEIKNLSLSDTIDWYHKYNIHPNNRSINKVHRAVNAFSQLFGPLHREISADLFWVMLGIESLLAEGNQSIAHQIREKSTLILGTPKSYSKKLTTLYNYRSRLVHGDFDLFPRFYSDYGSINDEYFDYLEFATSILIALLRELIQKKESEFRFELRLK